MSLIQETVPTPDDMVAVLNLLDHMTSLLDLELEAERGSSSETAAVEAAAETNGGGEPNLDSLPMVDRKMPCLDLLLSENILSHILATSRMPVSLFRCSFSNWHANGARHLYREEGLEPVVDSRQETVRTKMQFANALAR